jgi:hypothetical protein
MQLARDLKEIEQLSDKKTQSSTVLNRSSLRKQSRIVALIPRGEVIRNFVYTGCLDNISDAANLTLLTVSPGTEMDQMLGQSFEDVRPLKEFDEKWIVGIQRELLDMAHGRWLWSQAAQERWRLRDAEAKTFKQKTARTLKKLVCRPFASRAGLRTLSKIERATSRRFKTTDTYSTLFQELKPSLVFNGSHIHSRIATQAVQAAQWLGIPTATFIFSWDNLTSQGRIMLPYDYFLVWNETLRKQLLEMYEWIRPEQVLVTGTPQFDFHFRSDYYQSREEFCRSVGADPKRPIILYSTGMANHMPGEPEIVEGIADILNEMNRPDKPQLLVRVYPKDLTGRFDELKKRRRDILFPSIAWNSVWLTPKPEDSYSLVNTLRHSAVGINVASTISLELCMFDKPVINVGYNPPSVADETLSYANYYNFDHYRPIVESGAVEVASSREEMKKMLINALANPGERSKERAALMKKMFGNTLDGQSANRVADALLKIAAV